MVTNRSYLAFIVSVLSQFVEKLNKNYWNGIKRVFKHLKRTDYSLIYSQASKDSILIVYCDSN